METPRSPSCRTPLLAGVLALLASCSDALGGRAGVAGGMFIDSCSLACSRGEDGVQVFCSTVNTHQNRDITLRFSQAIDPASVGPATFRVVEASTGIPPGGQLLLDPADERALVYRPSLSFDAAGVPTFGLKPGVAYRLSVPGEEQGDPGPFVRSRSGSPNRSRLDCTIITDQGVLDLVPGAPSVEVFAEVVTAWDADGNPLQFEPGAPVPRDPFDLVDVYRMSPLRFVFADLMNPATLARNASGESPFVRVEVDGDGLLETSADRAPVPGRFEVRLDVARLTTELVFRPTLGYPSAGAVTATPARFVVITIPEEVTDLVGNPLPFENGGGRRAFVPERIDFATLTLPGPGGVRFEHAPGHTGGWGDAWRSGAQWGGGRLRPGIGSGSGRLGELIVRTGESVVLDTDDQAFPLPGRVPDQLGNGGAGDLPGPGPTLRVRDGVFEFAALRIEAGGRLVLRGRQSARLLVSGPVLVHHGGLLDLSGGSPAPHDSAVTLPQLGLDVRRVGDAFVPIEVTVPRGVGGPGGGDGGFGADRHDFGRAPEVLALTHLEHRSDARDLTGFQVDPSGRSGQGIGGADLGGGPGGARAAGAYPSSSSTLSEVSGSEMTFNVVYREGDDECRARRVGGAGGGGGYATPGTEGRAAADPAHSDYPIGQPNAGPRTPGGRLPAWVLGEPGDDNPARWLAGPEHELLRGGAGGGGGGSHGYETRAGGLDGPLAQACIGLGSPFVEWHDHSGASGGGGGGACSLSSASLIRIDGVLDASGGDGGSGALTWPARYALPGGGGAGGGVRLRAERVELGGGAGRVDVSGGLGGRFLGAPEGVRGGDGGAGLVRIEDGAGALERALVAPAILPYDPLDGSLRWLSLGPGAYANGPAPPEGVSAATSCWIRPQGLFYALEFAQDRGDAAQTQGWNMDLEWRVGGDLIRLPFRGRNPWHPRSLEAQLGNRIGEGAAGGGSAVAVRFQGARARVPGERFCDVPLEGPNRAVQEGSVTPWVTHPAELNAFEPRPDMLRFALVLDPAAAAWTAPDRALHAVTGLWVRACPE